MLTARTAAVGLCQGKVVPIPGVWDHLYGGPAQKFFFLGGGVGGKQSDFHEVAGATIWFCLLEVPEGSCGYTLSVHYQQLCLSLITISCVH